MTTLKTDPNANFDQLRNRRQQIAGSIRQLIDDWQRTRILQNRRPEKEHELDLLREALTSLGKPAMARPTEREFARQFNALQRELEMS